MTVFELDILTSRFRFIESVLGLAGCVCVMYAVWTPDWLGGVGLWTGEEENDTNSDSYLRDMDSSGVQIFKVLEVERVFAVLAFLMAFSGASLCLIFTFCWSSRTTRSYANIRSLLLAGQALYPTTLLLVVLVPTGFFFVMCWSFFTKHHLGEISSDFSRLGSSYWLGALGWVLLLGVLPLTFIVEQYVCPDLMADVSSLLKETEAMQHKTGLGSYNEGMEYSGSLSRDMSYRSLP
ncbi:uncharacterized protein [Lepisosteus oculatus]|uniref:uncharacterized protein n=1 Tax=Lepisosteus oculatus TaxID=7918 RepID=UPI0035F52659